MATKNNAPKGIFSLLLMRVKQKRKKSSTYVEDKHIDKENRLALTRGEGDGEEAKRGKGAHMYDDR